MARHITPRTGIVSIASVLLMNIFSCAPIEAQDLVRIKGQVIVSNNVGTDVDLTVDVGDTSCVRVMLYGRGRFEIDAFENEQYQFRFEQIGSVSKSITIDTKNADRKVGDKKRTIEFDVLMAPVDTVKPMEYAQPVGNIVFHHSNGRMVVERDKTMVREKQLAEID